MGVYIKGMKMPKNCWDCPFCLDFDFLDPYECAACMHDFEDGLDMYEHSRPDWCPLIPVPDHGRLIDADDADSRFTPDFTELSSYQLGWNAAMKRVCEDAPTIIQADHFRNATKKEAEHE